MRTCTIFFCRNLILPNLIFRFRIRTKMNGDQWLTFDQYQKLPMEPSIQDDWKRLVDERFSWQRGYLDYITLCIQHAEPSATRMRGDPPDRIIIGPSVFDSPRPEHDLGRLQFVDALQSPSGDLINYHFELQYQPRIWPKMNKADVCIQRTSKGWWLMADWEECGEFWGNFGSFARLWSNLHMIRPAV